MSDERQDGREMSIVELFEEAGKVLDGQQSPVVKDHDSALRRRKALESDKGTYGDWIPHREVETLLLEINRAITSTIPLNRVIQLVLDNIIQLTQTDRGFLMLKEEPGGKLKFIIARDKDKKTLAGNEFDISQGFVKKTLRSQKILYMEDALRDQRFKRHQSIFHLALRTIICAPLRLGDRTIGVIYADSRRRVNQFSDREFALLQLIVSQAAVAIENARLFRQSQRSEQKYRTLVETAQDIIISLDTRGHTVYVNPALKDILGLNPEQLGSLKGKANWIHAEDRKRIQACFRRALAGIQMNNIEFRGLHMDGGTKWLSMSLLPVLEGEGGKFCGVHGVLRDITDQREIYQQMSRHDKIQALGEMASGVAHDFNNILGGMLPRLQMVSSRISREDDRRDLQYVEKAADDGVRIVKRIQDFTRLRNYSDELQELDTNSVIEDCVELTRPRWTKPKTVNGISPVYNIQTELLADKKILGSGPELREMFTNLIFNAIDAMPTGGSIKITSRVEKGQLICQVKDNGTGMSEDVQKRVFDPFFTTKGDKGTGLGLSVVYGIVNRHRGSIELKSAPETGTTFTIKLPQMSNDAGAETAETDQAKEEQIAGNRILVVDTDEGIREVLSEILENFGHRVDTAVKGGQALSRLKKDEYDLLFTDLELSDMSGWDLAESVSKLGIKTKVVLVSGWPIEKDKEVLKQFGVNHILRKPLILHQIRLALDSVTSHPS